MRNEKIPSEFDGLKLEVAIATPVEIPKGIIQFSHGMAEHKERYFDFMNYLTNHGYVCVIHDHRGHGESVEMEDDYGFFYTENEQAIIDDLYTVTKFIKNEYPGIPLCLVIAWELWLRAGSLRDTTLRLRKLYYAAHRHTMPRQALVCLWQNFQSRFSMKRLRIRC